MAGAKAVGHRVAVTIAATDAANLRHDSPEPSGRRSRAPEFDRWCARALRVIVMIAVSAAALAFNRRWVDSFARPKTLVLEIAAAAIMVVAAIAWIRGVSLGERLPRPVAVSMGVLLAVKGLATAVGVDPAHSVWGEPQQLQGLVPQAMLMVVFVASARCFTHRSHLVHLVQTVAGTSALVAVYAVLQRLRLDPFFDVLPNGRSFSFLGQSNALGAVLVMGVCASVGSAVRSRRAIAVAWVGVAALDVIGVALTFSRAAYLSLIVAAVVVWAMWPPARRRRAIRVAASIAATGVLMAIPFGAARGLMADVTERSASIAAGRDDRSILEHGALWRVGLSIGVDHLAIGVGPDNYVEVFEEYRDRVLSADAAADLARYRPESPHNVLIAQLTDGGLMALIAYAAVIASATWPVIVWARASSSGSSGVATRGASRDAALSVALVACAAAHLVTDCFMTGEVAGSLVFWALLGAGLGTARACAPV